MNVEQIEGFTIGTDSPAETRAAAGRLARVLLGGETLGLSGPLGAGKTCFIQGLAEGLGVREPVTSPTFLIHRSHQGRLRMHHFDFYRLASEDDLETVGFYDFQAERAPAVIVVEWADRFPAALDEPVIEIEMRRGEGETERVICFAARGVSPARWDEIRREVSG